LLRVVPQRLGIDQDVQKLNVIHVAGTKGKV
jgi:folylpolyglutamate synthase/dihydropteroate synthase